MKRTQIIASGAAALVLLAAAPAFADTNVSAKGGLGLHLGALERIFATNHEGNQATSGQKDRDNDDNGTKSTSPATSTVSVSGTVTGISGSMLTLAGKDGAVYTVNAANASVTGAASIANVQLGDAIEARGTLESGILVAAKVSDRSTLKNEFKASLSGIAGGVVSAVSGNTITIASHGKVATTTVVTSGSTIVRAIGDASSTVGVGSRIFVVGTSSSSTPNTITADFIAIVGKGFIHLKHFFGF